jgi:hypothetical protein
VQFALLIGISIKWRYQKEYFLEDKKMDCIVVGFVERGPKNDSRWLVKSGGSYFTTLIPNKTFPIFGEVFPVKNPNKAVAKHLKKEIITVKILKKIRAGKINT